MSKRIIIKGLVVVAILAVGFLGLSLLGSTEKESKKRDIKPEIRIVATQTITFRDLALEIEGNGVIESTQTLYTVSEATGRVLYAKNNLKNGTFVKEHEKILEIDAREIENDLYAKRSDFLNATATLLPDLKIEDQQIYKKWLTFFSGLDINQPVPDLPEITTSQEKIKISTRNIFSKYYAVKNQEILLSKYKIHAPFDGFIRSNGIIKNSFVTRGQHLFTLEDARNLEMAVPLLADEINKIEFAKVPAVDIYSEKTGEVLAGKILRKDTKLDRNSQTVNVYVSFKNDKLSSYFLPGNYVHARIQGRKYKNVATIPRYLVDNENHVFTLVDGALNRQKVDVVTIQNDVAVIRNTIPDATILVTTVLQKPLVGMRIQPASGEAASNKEIQAVQPDTK